MNQKIKATATLIALCSVPTVVKTNKVDGKFNSIWEKFLNTIKITKKQKIAKIEGIPFKYSYSWDEYLPKTAIIITNIILENGSSFRSDEVTVDITIIDDIKRIIEILLEEKPIIEFDIEVITNENLTIEYKYSNFRKPQK